MNHEDQFTIGVELGLLLTRDEDHPTPWSDLEDCIEYELVAHALIPVANEMGVSVINTEGLEVEERPEQAQLFAAFHVQPDITVTSSYAELDRSVEVATPILRNGQWKWVLPKMCQALRENFDLEWNASTTLQVHIGNGGYSLQDLKRVSKAIIIFEKQMDTYHPADRSGDEFNIQSNRRNEVFRDLNDFEAVRLIDQTNNIDELLRIINQDFQDHRRYSRYYRYNLTSVKKYNTIEFKQAAGTDDEDQMLDWVSRVIRFVISATSTPDEIFYTWAQVGISDAAVYKQFGVPAPVYI